MAQDQRVEFLFAAQVSGQEQLQKLISSVDSLRKETEQLKTANAGLTSSTDAVIRNGVRYNNALDAQSKALRQNRQGTQQLGMQINDFATSVSTGASPVQAFNQQIGQVGFAMSQMGGIAGKVGGFLAGPWGAAVVIATMVLAPFIESLFNTGEAAKKAAEEAEKLEKRERKLAQIASDLVVARARIDQAMGKNVDSYLVGQQEAIRLANTDIASANKSIEAAKLRLQAARANIAANKTMQTMGTSLRAPGISIFAKVREYFQDNEGTIKKEKEDLNAIEDAMLALQLSLESRRGDMMDRANDMAEKDAKKGLAAAKRAAAEAKKLAKEAEAAREKEAKSIESFMDKIGKVGMKEIPAYQRQIAELEKDFMELSKTGQSATIAPFKAAVESIEMQQYKDMLKADVKEAEGMIKDILSNMDGTPISKSMEDIIARNEEVKSSFEAIGNSVSDAFKGMLTGAMSWKDGMRSLIASVIDQLWKLFVVQKIVGFVSNALGGASGMPGSIGTAADALKLLPPVPQFANGTMYAPGGMALVGERGPELVNLPRGSQVIPNHKMGGSGGGSNISVNVDARGSNDPAAVRAQVQQGILEAAPAIIAAAEARTISSMRRPRLGGAMQ